MSNIPKKVAFWFTDDLRLQDNLALNWACNHYASIAFMYVINPPSVSLTTTTLPTACQQALHT